MGTRRKYTYNSSGSSFGFLDVLFFIAFAPVIIPLFAFMIVYTWCKNELDNWVGLDTQPTPEIKKEISVPKGVRPHRNNSRQQRRTEFEKKPKVRAISLGDWHNPMHFPEQPDNITIITDNKHAD